jgi:hypothetical protein
MFHISRWKGLTIASTITCSALALSVALAVPSLADAKTIWGISVDSRV